MRIKVICDGPAHANDRQSPWSTGIWVDHTSFMRDLSSPGYVYIMQVQCPLNCNEEHLLVAKVEKK